MAVTTNFTKAQLDLREPVQDQDHFVAGSSLKVLNFLFNPKDYSMSLGGGWTFKPQKSSLEQPEFTGTTPRTLDVEMFLDATDRPNGDISGAVSTLLRAVRPTEKSVSSGTPFPPIVVFSWGSSRPFVGVVKQVSAQMTLFLPSGQPVRANCKVSMLEYDPNPPRQNPTSGALGSTRSHVVVLGDTLASIANAEYGAPALWRAIAHVNELEDPFNLRVGAELLLPPPADAVALA
jgi:nucleoid-associated protein YgaU